VAPWARGLLRLACAAALAAAGCDDGDPRADADAGPGADGDLDADTDRGTDAPGEADREAGDADRPEAEPGPLTMVATEIEVLLDRACDLDGNGVTDNAIADLGSPGAERLVAALSSVVQWEIEAGYRYVIHFPWLEDSAGADDPDAVLTMFGGVDVDDPWEPGDDFSGEEPFYVGWFFLDACGEPLCSFAAARLDRGTLSAEGGSVPLMFSGLIGRGSNVWGTVGPRGASGELTLCARAHIRELGVLYPAVDAGEATLLEAVLAGGGVWGIAGVPGTSPDLDMDGDGLERFALDPEGLVERCIDGDGSVIEGRDCFRDERMADAFALVIALRTVAAAFGGRVPGWQDAVEGTCESPPDHSLWDAR
jgi:hypothetical protein